MFEISYSITDAELDPTYKHVHHAVSISIMEKARLRLLEEIGHSNQSLIDRGYFSVIVGLTARYEREVRKGTVRVTCDSCKIRKKIFVMDQRILSPEGQVAVELSVTWMFMSGETKRAISPPEDFVAALESYLKKAT